MNKLLSLVLLTAMLISHSVYAETAKSNKTKSVDANKTMSDEEFMAKMMALDKREKDAIKQGETLDEINKLLGIDKQK